MYKIKIASIHNECKELESFLNDIVEYDLNFKLYYFGIVSFDGITKNDSYEQLSKNRNVFAGADQLLEVINNVEQIFEIEILIDDNGENIQRYSNEDDSYKNNQICLEFFDGGFWEITSKDHSLIKFISNKYL
jgi:hypothetical protein